MKKIAALLYFTAICLSLNAQHRVTGFVTEAAGIPVAGVVVKVQNAESWVVTDSKGYYSIEVPDDASILVYTMISYKEKQEQISGRSRIDVIMEPDMEILEEVVVVGFGTVRKSDLTSSISSIKGEDLDRMTAGNIAESMQGSISGVQIIGSTAPGSQPKVMIRGVSSINLPTDPLYVVDGIPMSSSAISYLSSGEIENVEVLKDASASAIYGSRASNGVIMITTKKGSEGKARFDFDLSYGLQQMKCPYSMADAVEYAEILDLAAYNSGYAIPYEDPSVYEGKTTDWWGAGIDEYSPVMNFNMNFGGGNDKHTYSVSANYYNQESFMKKGGYERLAARITNEFKFAKWISAGLSLNPRYENWGYPANWADFIRIDPITPVYKPDYELTGDENEYSIYSRSPSYVLNPVAAVARWNQSNETYALMMEGHVDINPVKDLHIRSQFGYELDAQISDSFSPDFVIDPANEFQTNNMVSRSQPTYSNWSLQNTITYNPVFCKKHNLNIMLGNTLEEFSGTTLWGQIEKIPNNNETLWELDAGTMNPQTGGTSYTNSILSFLGRIMYNYDSRYYVTASYRLDGSSKFMARNKWASFPSASVAWRISNEPFMRPVKGIISDMKLRVGWGRVGNQNLPSGVYTSTLGQGYYVFGSDIVNITYPASVKNEDIRWETVEDINVGLDLGFFNGKLSGTVEYYMKNTYDMLFEKTYPNYSGYPNGARIWSNVGSMRTSGFDVTLQYKDTFGDFYISAQAVLTTFDVLVTGLTGDGEPLYGNGERTRTEVGEEPGYFYGYVADGIFQNRTELNSHTNNKGEFLQPYAKEGDIRFLDVNGDGVLDANDRTKIGSPWADFTAGFNLLLGYRNFDLSANFYASVGNELVNLNISELYNGAWKTNKVSGLMDMAWHGEGTSDYVPRLSQDDNNENFTKFSSFYVEDGSFLRLKNLQLGYTFAKIPKLSALRLYVAAQNLFTLTGYSGVDPEVAGNVLSFGFGGYDYPVQRTFVVGINLKF